MPDTGVQETWSNLSSSRVSSFSQVPVSGLHNRQLSLLVPDPPHRSPELSRLWCHLTSGSRGREQETPEEGRYNSAVSPRCGAVLSLPVIRTPSRKEDLTLLSKSVLSRNSQDMSGFVVVVVVVVFVVGLSPAQQYSVSLHAWPNMWTQSPTIKVRL